MREWQRWTPAGVLGVGCLLLMSVGAQRPVALRSELTTLPAEFDGLRGDDRTIGAEEQRVAGMSTYLFRSFARPGAPVDSAAFSLYVGYYEQQTQGRSIHSPKNCLPGAGWEALEAAYQNVPVNGGAVRVNRYVLANKANRALVYYWYQGRGRVQANEYRIKLDLMRDAALKGHTEEALVRIVVPLNDPRRDREADVLAQQVVRTFVPAVYQVLPS
jgi:EpsI family protein